MLARPGMLGMHLAAAVAGVAVVAARAVLTAAAPAEPLSGGMCASERL